jgi:hypothetical protein
MRWPWQPPPQPQPSEDARHVLGQAQRQLADTRALGRAADDLNRRAEESNDRWRETRERNHVREAIEDAIKRKVQHP